eukprot:6184958-Pleurochrysis_carterae.AAC.3
MPNAVRNVLRSLSCLTSPGTLLGKARPPSAAQGRGVHSAKCTRSTSRKLLAGACDGESELDIFSKVQRGDVWTPRVLAAVRAGSKRSDGALDITRLLKKSCVFAESVKIEEQLDGVLMPYGELAVGGETYSGVVWDFQEHSERRRALCAHLRQLGAAAA